MNDTVVIKSTNAEDIRIQPTDRVVTPAQAEDFLEKALETAETIVISEDHSEEMADEVQ